LALAETQQDGATAGRTRQRMILEPLWLQTAEQAVAVLGKMPKVAIELLIPIGKVAQLGEALDLIDITGAQTAAVDFLQRHQIVIAQQFANALQVIGTPCMGQQMLPTTGQVMVITLRADPDLDIETQQA